MAEVGKWKNHRALAAYTEPRDTDAASAIRELGDRVDALEKELEEYRSNVREHKGGQYGYTDAMPIAPDLSKYKVYKRDK